MFVSHVQFILSICCNKIHQQARKQKIFGSRDTFVSSQFPTTSFLPMKKKIIKNMDRKIGQIVKKIMSKIGHITEKIGLNIQKLSGEVVTTGKFGQQY